MEILSGSIPFAFPCILGHEGAGVVAKIGSNVTSVAPGDKVLIAGAACRNCRHCDEGHPAYCESHMAYYFSGGRPDGSVTARIKEGGPLRASLFGGSTFSKQSVALAASVGKESSLSSLPLY